MSGNKDPKQYGSKKNNYRKHAAASRLQPTHPGQHSSTEMQHKKLQHQNLKLFGSDSFQ